MLEKATKLSSLGSNVTNMTAFKSPQFCYFRHVCYLSCYKLVRSFSKFMKYTVLCGW